MERDSHRGVDLVWWAVAIGGSIAAGLLAQAVGLPAPWLVAGLVAGLGVAAVRSSALELPRPVAVVGQVVVGVALGAQVRPDALLGVAGAWWTVLLVVALTLVTTLGVGLALARLTDLDRLTASLGMLPGAAPALIAVGDEVGADARLVATMQFGRVLLVVGSVPVLALAVGAGGAPVAGQGGLAQPALDGALPVVAALGVGAVGAGVARLLRAPAATLVGPLLLGAAVGASGLVAFAVPPVLAGAAFVTVGLSVGLQFDHESLRHAGRLAPAMAVGVVTVMVGCAAIGVVLWLALDTDPLTAYLATTPGGISAVLAAALDTGANLTIVVAVQTVRLLALAAAAPFAARLLRVRAPA